MRSAPLLLVAVLLAAVLWFLLGRQQPELPAPPTDGTGPAEVPAVADATVPAPTADAADATAGDAGPTTADHLRSAATAADEPGSLRVLVLYETDHTPAAGAPMRLHRRRSLDSRRERRDLSTDERGELLFAPLAAGDYYVESRRGDSGEWVETKVIAGQRTSLEFLIKPALDLTGIVIDHAERPVGGAEVVVAGWGGGDPVVLAHTAADGTFAARAIGPSCHVGARAVGFVPTPLLQFTAQPGAKETCRLQFTARCAAVHGQVLGPDERPVAAARVQIGDENQRNRTLGNGQQAMGPRPEQQLSDGDGRFTFTSVELGEQPLIVVAESFAPMQTKVTVHADRPAEVTVRLQPGVVVEGIVKDDQGKPLALAEITSNVGPYEFRRNVRSQEDGGYRCDGLPIGDLELNAEDREGKAKAKVKLSGAPGQVLRWDPVLSRGLELKGIVLDDADKPVRVMVEARQMQPTGGNWWGYASTDEQGRFSLANCTPGAALRLDFRRHIFTEHVERNVMPGGEELVVRIPKAGMCRIRGRLLDPDGKPLPSATIHSIKTKNSSGSPVDSPGPDGAFDLGPYPAGEYKLSFNAAGYPTMTVGPRDLGLDEMWDLGDLRMVRGGSLQVTLLADTPGPPPDVDLSVYSGDEWSHRLPTKNGRSDPLLLLPGDYRVQIPVKDWAQLSTLVTVRAGETTQTQLTLRKGSKIEIAVALPPDHVPEGFVSLKVFDAAGEFVHRNSIWLAGKELKRTIELLPGEYRVEARHDKIRGEATVRIGPGGTATVTVELK